MKGQLFVRKTGTMINGEEAVIITGVVTLNELEKFTINSECQYTIKNIELHENSCVNRNEMAKGMSIDGLLCSPIWRV
ncbi:MAG: hypothetical protein K0R54_127 [Clostridiaceae bacterium]|jgi:hypothetical protein|nr:hypothetical protein [Clostridiaceae bacterium]